MPRFKTLGTAITAGLTLLFSACSDGGERATPADTGSPAPTTIVGTAPPTLDPAGGGIAPATPDEPPPGTFEVGGEEHALGLGSYCWSPPRASGLPAICVDTIGYIAPPGEVTVTAGATLAVTGGLAMAPIEVVSAHLWPAPAEPVEATDEFTAWRPEGDALGITVTGTTIALPDNLEPGRYLLALDIISIDPGSSATYSVVLQVE